MSHQVPGQPDPQTPPPGHQPWPQGQPGPPPAQVGQGYTVPHQSWPQGQPPGQFGPMGTVALTIQGNEMTSNMIVPTVTINGHRIHTRYGRQDIPVPPGPVHIAASAQWILTYGQAAMDFSMQAGQVVPVFYAAPMHQFSTGSMGHEQQKRKGVAGFIGFIGVVVLILVAILAMTAILTS